MGYLASIDGYSLASDDRDLGEGYLKNAVRKSRPRLLCLYAFRQEDSSLEPGVGPLPAVVVLLVYLSLTLSLGGDLQLILHH